MNAIAHLLTQTITIARRSGVSADGSPTFGTKESVKARVEKKTRLLRDANGNYWEQFTVIATLTEIPMGSRVWLPDVNTNDNNLAVFPISVESATSISDGSTFYEVYV